MAVKKNYKKISFPNGELFVAGTTAYTDRTNISGFSTNAASGEIGLFKVSDGTQYDATTGVPVGDEFVIIQKQDSELRISNPMIATANMVRETAYVAPVIQVSAVGYNGTSGATNHITIAAGQDFGIGFSRTDLPSEPLKRYSWTTRSNTSSVTMTDLLLDICAQANNDNSMAGRNTPSPVALELLAAATPTNWSGTQPMVVTNGSTLVTTAGIGNISVGSYVRIPDTDAAATSASPIYKVVAIEDTNNFRLNMPYQGATHSITTATHADTMASFTAWGVRMTAKDYGIAFEPFSFGNLDTADKSTITAFKYGKGFGEEVQFAEEQLNTFFGDTVKNTKFAADFGQPTKFAAATSTYNYYFLEPTKTKPSNSGAFAQDVELPKVFIAALRTNASTDGDLVDSLQILTRFLT